MADYEMPTGAGEIPLHGGFHNDNPSQDGSRRYAPPLEKGYACIYNEINDAFPGGLFRSPAWEILFILKTKGHGFPAEVLDQYVKGSASLVRRWLQLMEAEGVVSSYDEAGETLYTLTPRAREVVNLALTLDPDMTAGGSAMISI